MGYVFRIQYWSLSGILLNMKIIVTINLALFSALIVAGSRLEATEGQNVTISFDIDEVEKADSVQITFKGVNEKQPSVIARRPWIYDDKPPAGVSLQVEKGRVSVTIQHVNISSSGLYTALAIFGKKLTVNAVLVVKEASFSSTKAPPHTSSPKPPDSSNLLWLCTVIPLLIVISGVVCFCKCMRNHEIRPADVEKDTETSDISISPSLHFSVNVSDPVSPKERIEKNNCNDCVAVSMSSCGENAKALLTDIQES